MHYQLKFGDISVAQNLNNQMQVCIVGGSAAMYP